MELLPELEAVSKVVDKYECKLCTQVSALHQCLRRSAAELYKHGDVSLWQALPETSSQHVMRM